MHTIFNIFQVLPSCQPALNSLSSYLITEIKWLTVGSINEQLKLLSFQKVI